MNTWTTLTTIHGKTIPSPDESAMTDALRELFQSGTTEHPDCWLEKGSDDGPMDVLSIYSSGYAIHTQYTDADMIDENFSKRIDGIDATKALKLWKELIGA